MLWEELDFDPSILPDLTPEDVPALGAHVLKVAGRCLPALMELAESERVAEREEQDALRERRAPVREASAVLQDKTREVALLWFSTVETPEREEDHGFRVWQALRERFILARTVPEREALEEAQAASASQELPFRSWAEEHHERKRAMVRSACQSFRRKA
jgi:hypothetical protein